MAEKAGVMRTKASSSSSSSEPDLLAGLPYRVSSSMSASKDQMLVQVRVIDAHTQGQDSGHDLLRVCWPGSLQCGSCQTDSTAQHSSHTRVPLLITDSLLCLCVCCVLLSLYAHIGSW
jgi:hypothetical protein